MLAQAARSRDLAALSERDSPDGAAPARRISAARNDRRWVADREGSCAASAIQALGSMNATKTGDSLVSMYGSETDPAVKRSIVDSLHSQRNAKALVDLARKETDPEMKREIVSRLSNIKSKESDDYFLELLK
jgi:hypothetical protein